MPLAWGAAGVAAVISAIAIMLKGGMVKKPRRLGLDGGGSATGPGGAGGAAGDDTDPFRRHPLPVAGQGSLPTQTETGVMPSPGDWGGPSGDPSVSYESPGDGGGGDSSYSSGGGGDLASVAPAGGSVSYGGVAAHSAGHPGTGGGGYQAPFSPAVAPSFSGGYTGGFVPYSSNPSPTPIATQAGNYYVPGSGGLHIE